jgi:hypothetical protein
MMKKFLFVAAAVVASMVFTGCINEDDTYKKLQPVQQGINIYNWTSSQYSMATEQANIGMRMAMLVAEADKQGVEKLEDVKIEGVSIKSKLLGTSSTIEKRPPVTKSPSSLHIWIWTAIRARVPC